MNPIEKIKEKLTKYPHAKYEIDSSSITVFPATDEGFEVTLIVNSPDSYTVQFEGWHEELSDVDEALNLFAFGLSSDCRIKEYRRGNFAYKWTLESKGEDSWSEEGTVGLLIFPFWKKATVRVRQNCLVK